MHVRNAWRAAELRPPGAVVVEAVEAAGVDPPPPQDARRTAVATTGAKPIRRREVREGIGPQCSRPL
jgi:hypothetical protein